jgi:hypothetical protein
LWKTPYTSSFWDQLYPAQWRIFAEHIALDRYEEEERFRDISEYAMAFHNFEAVQAVQRARQERGHAPAESEENNEDIFLQQVSKLFGRELNKEIVEKSQAQPENNLDEVKVIRTSKPLFNQSRRTRRTIEEQIENKK